MNLVESFTSNGFLTYLNMTHTHTHKGRSLIVDHRLLCVQNVNMMATDSLCIQCILNLLRKEFQSRPFFFLNVLRDATVKKLQVA